MSTDNKLSGGSRTEISGPEAKVATHWKKKELKEWKRYFNNVNALSNFPYNEAPLKKESI